MGACLVGGCDDLCIAAGSLCSVDLPLHVVDPSSSGIRDWSACNRMIVCHARSLDLNEETPAGISEEEDCGGLSLQGRPKTPGKMLCESPNWVKYDWPKKPEHSGLGHVSVPEKPRSMCISTCRMENQHSRML